MEIFTLVKANIRKKKGSFISIIMLTTLLVAAVVTILGVKENYHAGMKRAFETSDVGAIMAFAQKEKITDELKNKVENSDLVERVVYYDAICSNGQKVGNRKDGNSAFLMEMREGIEVYNENRDGFLKTVPELKAGEIYLPLGLRAKLSCEVGDTITIYLIQGIKREFKIKNFVQEPTQGAMLIGWKQIFISKEDYDEILKECHEIQAVDEQAKSMIVDITTLMIYQNPECDMSVTKFQRELNKETKVIATSAGALNIEQSVHYSTLMADVILNIVLVFAIFLFVIVLIVMAHSISTEIEIDYVTVGVLKSQGFSKEKLRQIFLWQYGLAEVLGIILGCCLAVPLQSVVGEACQGLTGILPTSNVVNNASLLLIFGMVVVSFVLIHISTKKVVSISPVRAILGGTKEIYFDHYFQLPIGKKMLATSLAFRQFTSAKKRYWGIILIVAILTFFMVTVNLVGNLLSMEHVGANMGLIIPDVQVYYENPDVVMAWEDVDALVETHSEIEHVNSITNGYVSLNGENLMCEVYDEPETIPGMIDGRQPLYENELLITEIVAETLELEVGDEVTVSREDDEMSCIISGMYQSASDTGMVFCMNSKGLARLRGKDTVFNNRYYVLEDKTKRDTVRSKLEEKYGDDLTIEVYTEENNPVLNQFGAIVSILKLIINAFSLIFVAVAIRMVCTKTFLQERTDIGVYKAIGFTSTKLRNQFALRFFLVALIGAMLGVLLSFFASAKVLSVVLRMVGLTRVVLAFTFGSLMMPVIIISTSCMVFAFFATRKIKKVEVRELVVE